MSEPNQPKALVITLCTVHDSEQGLYEVGDTVDPATGYMRVIGKPRISQPGTYVELSEGIVDELLKVDAVRYPTKSELQLHQLAQQGI